GLGGVGGCAWCAAEAIALGVGSGLVGAAEGAGGLEMALLGGTFVFPEGGVLALTGSDFGATLDDAAAPLWASCEVKPGQTLGLRSTRSGARCYLCGQGGIEVKSFVGSA